MTETTTGRGRDFGWILIAYVVAIGAAALTVAAADETSPLWLALYGDIAATVVIFAFSTAFKNSSFYDAYWSVGPPVLMLYWWWSVDWAVDGRQLLLGLLVALWGIRLTHNWARGWTGLKHVDWRYVDLRAQTGAFYPVVDLLGIQGMPTLLTFLGSLPLYYLSIAEPVAWSSWDALWILIGYGALWLENRADNVLRAFRQSQAAAGRTGEVLDHDVWAWCRHPNYLGELGFWLSLAIAGYLVTGVGMAWAGIAGMVVLFVAISIPMIDKRQLANKPAYANYRTRVPSLIPYRLPRGERVD